MPLKHAIAQVINGRHLSFDEAAAAMDLSLIHISEPTRPY